MKQIHTNNHYINNGNIFSKYLLIHEFIKKNQGPVLYIFSENETSGKYKKINDFLGGDFHILSSFSEIVEIYYNHIGNYFTPLHIFEKKLPVTDYEKKQNIFSVKKGEEIQRDEITKKLHAYGYTYSEYSNNGTFFIQGDILSFTNTQGNYTYKIDFWGDTVEDIFIINNKNKSSLQKDEIYFGNNISLSLIENGDSSYKKENNQYIGSGITILDGLDFYTGYEDILTSSSQYICFDNFSQNHEIAEINLGIQDVFIDNIEDLKTILEKKVFSQKYIYTKNKKSVENFLDYNNFEDVKIIETSINILKSFQTSDSLYICDDNISRIFVKKRVNRKIGKKMDLLMQIKPGDFIVHVDHGIGIFQQITEKELNISGNKVIKKEYVELKYKNNDTLYIPITEVSRINKYVGVENPKLTGLSTQEWEKKLKKVNEDVERVAQELLEIYAQRELEKGFEFRSIPEEETKFFNSFEYIYTDDQYTIIKEIYAEMESSKPMDRLVSGDVGFGKTEIAFAAIFKALINGKQAALISPLVVLAYEHFEKSLSRFKDFPYNIGVLTRFETKSKITETLQKLKEGKIDLIVGTHKLLSEDVEFKDLGLLVIDEEHKFGVKHKDKIKEIRKNIDVLSLSATPIPRSLNMALNGLKTMSMLTTPPVGRQSIDTIVLKYDEKVIQEAGKRELERGGQLFFIHNKVTTIETQKSHLEKIFPGKKIIIAHGQLSGDQLEKRIISFKKREYDILLATTVIENGIDFSNVNTIFINDAYNFGISQIHQLRGRVGRSDRKGFCYLLFNKDKIKEDAAKRLKTIVDYSHLGAGFELAIKDLEIRGGGDILGVSQSGQQSEIGINLYLEMLENKIDQLKNHKKIQEETKQIQNSIQTKIDLQLGAYIDNSFFQSELDKINFYREIESLESLEDLKNIITDFFEINTHISNETQNFFDMLEVKMRARDYKIIAIKKVGINYQLDFDENITIEELKKFLETDTEVKFEINKLYRLRASVKKFQDEENFLQYLLNILKGRGQVKKKKIKLKK